MLLLSECKMIGDLPPDLPLTNHGEPSNTPRAANVDPVRELCLLGIGGVVIAVAELVDRESKLGS